MSTLGWIISSSLLMSAIALAGSATLLLKESTLWKIILPLVALAAGTLISGAFFHMIPAGLSRFGGSDFFYLLIMAGFTTFFGLEQGLHWHHCRDSAECREPLPI